MYIHHRVELRKLLSYYELPWTVAEIGVAEGRFSLDMIKWGLHKLYLVDNWGKIEGVTGDGNYENEWHDKVIDVINKKNNQAKFIRNFC